MVDVIGENIIKANIVGGGTPISANIVKSDKTIKGSISGIPSATTERKGIIRIATLEEAIQGTDNTIAITPYTLNKVTTYVHEQGIASDTWIINHNLNKKPSITIVDSADNVVEGAEKYIDNNTIEIYFNGAFKGKDYERRFNICC